MHTYQLHSISETAVALANGGRFLRTIAAPRGLLYEIETAEPLDLTDPNLVVPVPALLAWSKTLTTMLQEHRRRSGVAR